MIRLIIVSFIWAFSFSLIGNFLVGKMDTYLAIFIRFATAFVIFIPFLNFKTIFSLESLKLIGIGALQLGVMYIFYFNSFHYLSVVEVALFTIMTPMYISLIGNIFDKNFYPNQFLNVLLVIVGAGIIKWGSISEKFFLGFILVQGANLSFGLGQVLYKRYCLEKEQKRVFSLFYLGALVPISFLVLTFSNINISNISGIQWTVLMWLGLVASGIGYYLWNTGTKLVSYGQLAVMNNAVIPLAIIVNVIFWSKQISWPTFLIGSVMIISGIFLETRKKAEWVKSDLTS
jgi:drug/metabolite transporter (DMT)-like permease